MMVGLEPNGRVLFMQSLFSVWVNVYLTHQRLFPCLGDLPAEGLPPVVEIYFEAFAAQRYVCAVSRADQVTHLGGISQLDCQTKACKRDVKSMGTEYMDLDFRGLTFAPLDCASWLLRREADRPLNVFEALLDLFPLLTGQELPFKEALAWLQFAYTTDQTGAYVAPESMVLSQSVVAEGGELFLALLAHLRRRYT